MSSEASKKLQKELNAKYKEQVRNTEAVAIVVSDRITQDLIQDQLPGKLKEMGLSPELLSKADGAGNYKLAQPGQPDHVAWMSLGTVDGGLMAEIADLEILMDEPLNSLRGKPCITIRTKANMSPVNLLFLAAVKRALGPLTEGTLIDKDVEYVSDDWITWSPDYLGPKIVDVRGEFQKTLRDNPDLVFENTDSGGKGQDFSKAPNPSSEVASSRGSAGIWNRIRGFFSG